MVKKFSIAIVLVVFVGLVFVGESGAQDTGPASVYEITVSQFELWNGSEWVTVFTGTSAAIDIAAANTNAFAGTFLSGLTIPDGIYTRSRTTVGTSIRLSGFDGNDEYTTATTGNVGANVGCQSTAVSANEAACTVVLDSAPVETHTFTGSLTVKNGVPSHKIRVIFDVSQAVNDQGGGGVLLTNAPSVTVQILSL